jgi:hypothetical protein
VDVLGGSFSSVSLIDLRDKGLFGGKHRAGVLCVISKAGCFGE